MLLSTPDTTINRRETFCGNFFRVRCFFSYLQPTIISAGFSGFIFLQKILNLSRLLPVFRMSTLAENMPHVVYYQKWVRYLGAMFVRKHPLAPGLLCILVSWPEVAKKGFVTT